MALISSILMENSKLLLAWSHLTMHDADSTVKDEGLPNLARVVNSGQGLLHQ
jgi:hypothetical protein